MEQLEAELKTQFDAQNRLIADLTAKLNALTTKVDTNVRQAPIAAVEEYRDLNVNVSVPKDVSLDIYKTLPEFNGEREKYATWRSMVTTAIGLLKNHQSSMRFYEALMIIRNKITGPASNILNNYNTVFNFDAIIDRLDFTYSDKRPLYILEQELMVLQQNELSMDAFYDLVNEKLNAIVNKINMTYKEKQTAKSFIESANEKALRTFITGLNNRKGEMLYAANPSTLPEAYARLQTIVNDQERISFASRYNSKSAMKSSQNMRNPQFKPVQQQGRFIENHQASVTANLPSNNKFGGQQNWREKIEVAPNNVQSSSHVEHMEVDKTSTAVNVERNQSNRQFIAPVKRDFSKNNTRASFPQREKVQRLNNVTDETAYARTIVHDELPEAAFDEEFEVPSNEFPDETSSIFLGN